jgi:hypothetical protein
MKFTTAKRRSATLLGAAIAAVALFASPALTAQAYVPQGGVVYQLGNDPCLKGRGNCAIYPKSAQLPSGRIVAAFEKSTVSPTSGAAAGQTMPVYRSDDNGDSWQPLADVKAPAYLSTDPAYAKYTSNWTNPYLYVMPQAVGNLAAGTLLLSSVVSGEDAYYTEHKAADPYWVPSNDGDRRDLAIALYASNDSGATWRVVNVIATGGWQGGSAGATGVNIANANTARQVDPVWEPHLIVRNNQLVAYYSDENDYLSYDTTTGVPVLDPQNATAPDSLGQILVHKTWDGRSSSWSSPVVDVPGLTENRGNGKTQIGGGRPGMTTVAPTTDGKWLMTFEYFGGGDNVRFKTADDPLRFFASGDYDGDNISSLPRDPGTRTLATGGSPVLVPLPDGRILYNASNSGDIWVNESGRSNGEWTEYQTPLPGGYSRNMQYVKATGQILVLAATWGGPGTSSVIRNAHVDLGYSAGDYFKVVNKKTGQVIGTASNTNDDNIGNGDVPSVASEAAGSAWNPNSQYWHVITKADGNETLINKTGGREAAIWSGNATTGQRIGLWVDNTATGLWNMTKDSAGNVRFQSVRNPDLYLTGATSNSPLTLQTRTTDGSQDWQLVK